MVWTLIPLAIVLVLFGLTAKALIQVNRPIPGALKVEVTGYQFWWDFHYPELGLRNSNELVLPAGVPVELEITSKDVIHSFWVPGLSGKRDAIPGQTTRISFEPKEPGLYYGFCAELCGASHARMLFRVVVLPKEEFDRFVEQAKASPAPVADERGQQVFQQNCAACHGVARSMPPAVIGPELGLLGNRTSLGAGIVENTPENLKAWIRDPAGMKPGVKMPGFPQLSEEDLDALARYLEGLKVEGLTSGPCPSSKGGAGWRSRQSRKRAFGRSFGTCSPRWTTRRSGSCTRPRPSSPSPWRGLLPPHPHPAGRAQQPVPHRGAVQPDPHPARGHHALLLHHPGRAHRLRQLRGAPDAGGAGRGPPRVNAFSYWAFLGAIVLALMSYFFPGGALA